MADSIASPYVVEYAATYTFAATPEQVWAVMERFETLAPTWTWLRELRVDGPGLQTETMTRGVVVPPLPYRMRLIRELRWDPHAKEPRSHRRPSSTTS